MKKIKLLYGKIVLVDDEDFEYLNQFKWRLWKSDKKYFYAIRSSSRKLGKQKTIFMHREILKIKDKNIMADHINGNGLDNRKVNLRAASNLQNQGNAKKSIANTSGYKGVCLKRNGWYAQIYVNKKQIYLGVFKDIKEAALAYNRAAEKHFGEFAYLNNI